MTLTELTAVEDATTDEHLGTQIREALSQFLSRYGSQFEVAVNDGAATVAGIVPSLWLKIQVGRIVSEIAAVRDFTNDVEVIPEEPVSDEFIVRTILETLEMYESIDTGRIEVEAEGGVVTLLGSVPTHSAKQAVCNAVLNKAGVRDLRNNLQTMLCSID
jgi:osmotically-inducible protein OsmY